MLLQTHSPMLRPMTTAHLAQTMTLLEMSSSELREKIESELASNPALELIEEWRCPTCHRRLAQGTTCPFCARPINPDSNEPIVFVSSREDFHTGATIPDEYPDETQTATAEDLPHYVLRQIAPDLKPADRSIAAYILTNLNDDGLLEIPVLEIARFFHVPSSRIHEVLNQIRRADPVGVASSTPQDALLIQIEVLAETQSVPHLAAEAVRQGMNLLSRRRYSELAHLLGVTTAHARNIATFISQNLNPFPGRTHWGDQPSSGHSGSSPTSAFHTPDIIIGMLDDSEDSPLVVEIAMPIAGSLRVNPLFKEAIQEAPQEKAEQWKNDMDSAILLVKCLQQRNHTIVRLMQRLTVLQRNYILRGEAHLQPITRAALSKELEVHESTISRAVSSKAVQLPNGHIVPLSQFFDRSLHIRTALKQIIDQENRPLSDTEIGEQLAQIGYPVARRTVAKYRSLEGILPAHLRKPPQMPAYSRPAHEIA